MRYFAVVAHFDLLAQILGGTVRVPRQVLDPDDDPDGIAGRLSEIGRTERHFAKRSSEIESWSRIHALRQREDIETIDLDEDEVALYAELTGRGFTKARGLAGVLGPGEAAVIALAESRGWAAVLDDAVGRAALVHRCPDADVWTTVELLKSAAARGLIESPEAEHIYLEMKARGYRGPQSLWGA